MKHKNPVYRVVDMCPTNLDENTNLSPDYLKFHRTLIENIFYRPGR